MAEVVTRGLEDVDDVIAFGTWLADRAFKNDDFVAIEEARAEAVVLIFELHEAWDPVKCEKFSAYLLSYLPRRLIDWRRRELRQSGRGSWAGRKGTYVYYRTVSLDDNRETITQATYDPGVADDLVAQAIRRLPPATREQAQEVVHLSAAGWGAVEIGSRIGMSGRAVNEIKRVVGDSVVNVLVEQEGYTRLEAIRLLRVPTHIVHEALTEQERNSV